MLKLGQCSSSTQSPEGSPGVGVLSKPFLDLMSTCCCWLQLEAALESLQRMVSDKLSVGELMTTQLTALEPVTLVSRLGWCCYVTQLL